MEQIQIYTTNPLTLAKQNNWAWMIMLLHKHGAKGLEIIH